MATRRQQVAHVDAEQALAIRAEISDVAWKKFLLKLASGDTVADAAKSARISFPKLRLLRIADPEKYAEIEDAKNEYNLRHWSEDDIEKIMTGIVHGLTVKDAISFASPATLEDPFSSFMSAMLNNPLLKDKYDRAQAIRYEMMADEMLAEAEDDTEDLLVQEKGPVGNTARVRRSEIRINTRKWLMSKYRPETFGDQKGSSVAVFNNTVNNNLTVNHAQTLEQARSRREKAKLLASDKEAIDAEFTEVD